MTKVWDTYAHGEKTLQGEARSVPEPTSSKKTSWVCAARRRMGECDSMPGSGPQPSALARAAHRPFCPPTRLTPFPRLMTDKCFLGCCCKSNTQDGQQYCRRAGPVANERSSSCVGRLRSPQRAHVYNCSSNTCVRRCDPNPCHSFPPRVHCTDLVHARCWQ